ncbi:MAG TPA: AMP-binding protein [Terriglobia bacterium]|nr:AMP-binding protein [Terriglobia bacterium]
MKLTVPKDAPVYPTILHALEDVARRTPDRTALICEDRSLTFAQHRRAIAGFARTLKSIGVENERVAVLMTNCLEMPVCILGAMAAHGYVAPMNPNYSESELKPLLQDTAPKMLITQPEFKARISTIAAHMGIEHVLIIGEGDNTIAAWMEKGADALPQPLPLPDDYAMMFFTGGTTGLPKGAEHRHRNIMAFCRLEAAFFATLGYDCEVSLSVAPMFHIFGHHHGVIHPLYIGSTHVLIRQYKPDIVLEQLSKYKVTLFAGGPATVYVGLLAAEGMKKADLSSLKICCAGGSACSEDLLRQWSKTTGCAILEGIGMSEGAPYANNPAIGTKKILSVGVPPPDTEIQIVDLETGERVLPQGERGEIRVRGPQMFSSYRNRPEETANTVRNGWIHTGDIGYFDEEGYLFVVDRKKELIISGGFNIYPREVDEVLNSHPATLEVATVGLKDSFRGEIPVAFVALKPGMTVSAEELIAYCKERLVDYKVPRKIEFRDALPKTGPGKIDKLKLRGLRD